MIEIPGITITEEVSQGYRSVLYRGCNDYSLPSLIKVYKMDDASSLQIAQFKHEFHNIFNIKSDGFVKARDLKFYNSDLAIILEDFSGISLNDFIKGGYCDIQKFIEISIQLARAVGDLHNAGVTHNELKPKIILINPTKGIVKIIDYGFSSIITRENEQIYLSEVLDDILPYISPEQTERMNRSVDYRTDFYSLGIIFYELLTGSVPFYSKNPLELFHSHIARIPETPIQCRADIPEVISEIIMKLLSKNPEDRYQSAFGLMSDLEKFREQIESTGSMESFIIGQHDVSDKLIIPQKIYGREDEIVILMASFNRVKNGRSELMLVSGYSGVGKTVLINEIHKPIVKHKGYFLWGKYDKLIKNMPYSTLIQAFQGLIKQLLTESDDRIIIWKKLLLEALGNNGRIITDVIPEVELLTGRQPEVSELGADEVQTRFNLVFQDFVRVFPSADHPVVVFLDDLQWVDSASLDLIGTLIADSSIQCILFIGAFRDNEVTPSHPLRMWLDDIEKAGIERNQLSLKPLNLQGVNLLVADTLKCSADAAFYLSNLIYQKTEGNPFFVKQFLTMLYDEGMLTFSAWTGWQWDVDIIKEMEVTDNIVDLMTKKIERLPQGPLDVLKIASCIGSRFNLEMLSESYGKSNDETYGDLYVSMDCGFVLLKHNAYRFSHDRVQEAAYSLISDEERNRLHYNIGQILLQKTRADELFEKVFDIVNQFNLCMEIIADQKERIELAGLNLAAGLKAKGSAAYEAANRYLEMGIGLLPEDAWEEEYDLTLSIYTEMGEVKYLIGDPEHAEIFFDTVLKQAKNLLDKVRVYEVKLASYTSLNKRDVAFDIGIEVLSMLGFDMPEEAVTNVIMEEMNLVKKNIGNREVEELIDLPELSDPKKLATARILMSLSSVVYTSAPKYLPVIIFKMVNLSLKHGNSIYSPFAYVAYGLILCGRLGEIETGCRFGELALKIINKYTTEVLKAKVYYIVGDFINHWKNHYREDLPYLLESYRIGSETGDILFASYAVNHYIITSFLMGEPLIELKEKIDKYYEIIQRYQQLSVIQEYQLWGQMVVNLMGGVKDKLLIKGAICDEKEIVQEWERTNMLTAIGYYTVAKQIVLYLYGDFKCSIKIARYGERCIDTMTGMNLVAEYHFYYSLALLAHYPNAVINDQTDYLKIIENNQEKMKKWAEHAPDNFLHKYLLVEAELSRQQGEIKSTINLYDRAIELAGQNSFIQDEAIANERAALFYLSEGMEKIARIYMNEAINGYKRWGAVIKADDLKNEYPNLLDESVIEGTFNSINKQSQKLHQPEASRKLDYSSIVNSLQAISSEIVFENLLDRLMKIVVESSGATRGIFISLKDDNLFIEAERVLSDKEVTIVKSVPVDERDDLLMPVINYVKRSLTFVVLDDAINAGDYISDPYVMKSRQRSVFCMPVIRQTELVGILYLENNVAAGAFTLDRIEVLKLLAAQTAISLENAKLIDEIKNSEKEKSVILDSLSEVIIFHDRDLKNIWVNRSAAKTVEKLPEELVGLACFDVWFGRDEPCEGCPIIKTFDTGISQAGEVILPDGRICWTQGHPIFSMDGEVDSVIEINRDITEERKAERALKASEERYRSMFNNNHSIMLMVDLDTLEIVDANPAACSFYGYSHEKLTSMRITDINTLPADQVFQEMGHARLSENQQFFFCHRLASGELRDVEVYSGPINFFGRQLLYSIIHDISDRKKAEEELQNSEDRYWGIFENTNSGVAVYKAVNNGEDFIFIDFNSSAEKIEGTQRENVIGKRLTIVFPGVEEFGLLDVLRRVWQTGNPEPYPISFYKDDRIQGWRDNFVYRLRSGEVVAVYEDITERKQTEDELARYRDHLEYLVMERTEKLEDAQEKLLTAERLAVLGKLSGGISHELRNPLGVIDSSVYYLKRKLDDADPKVIQHLDRIKSHVKRSTDIIESLLNLTIMKEPIKERLDFAQVLSEAILASRIPGSVKVIRDILKDQISIFGDEEQIRMIFENIIKNAVDAMEKHGTLTIITRISKGGEFAEVTFEDTGPGIADEDKDKIFQPLYSTKTKGIGFGLSICQQIIEKHGGKIDAFSDTGSGASFIVQFPMELEKKS